MLYQGEDIIVTIKGDEHTDLTLSNFVVFIYSNTLSEGLKIKKEKGLEKEGSFTFIIPGEETKELRTGWYNVEVLLKMDNSRLRSIYKKTSAFFLNPSIAKDYLDDLTTDIII